MNFRRKNVLYQSVLGIVFGIIRPLSNRYHTTTQSWTKNARTSRFCRFLMISIHTGSASLGKTNLLKICPFTASKLSQLRLKALFKVLLVRLRVFSSLPSAINSFQLHIHRIHTQSRLTNIRIHPAHLLHESV